VYLLVENRYGTNQSILPMGRFGDIPYLGLNENCLVRIVICTIIERYAESSLCNVSGYHQVGSRRVNNSHRGQTISLVHPAKEKEEDIIGEETIYVEDWGPLTEPIIHWPEPRERILSN
jgi:hypothetical protein